MPPTAKKKSKIAFFFSPFTKSNVSEHVKHIAKEKLHIEKRIPKKKNMDVVQERCKYATLPQTTSFFPVCHSEHVCAQRCNDCDGVSEEPGSGCPGW